MAKTTLPTNYVDDVLNGAMDGKRRYREIPNADGTISLEDATTYDQVGSNFGASQLNLMSDNINQSFDSNKMLKTMDEVNAVTQEGYGVDALVVKELNSSLNGLLNKETVIDTLISSGTETSWTNKTIKDLSQYKNIIFNLQRSSSEPIMFNTVNIPYELFKTMTSESKFLTIATGNTNAYIYYVNDTTVSCKVSSGWAYCLYGVK